LDLSLWITLLQKNNTIFCAVVFLQHFFRDGAGRRGVFPSQRKKRLRHDSFVKETLCHERVKD